MTMLKLVFCIRKLNDMDEAAFRRHWRETHAPLVQGLSDALRLRRYIQSHTVHKEFNDALVEGRGMAAPYDGIAEVWWDNVETALEAMNSPAGQEANKRLIEDEVRFVDLSRCTAFITEEHVIF
jgi:uncharacterized protein (TIGR02118 family)